MQSPPPGAMTADTPGGPIGTPPSAGMQLATLAGQADQAVQTLQSVIDQATQAMSMVAHLLQSVVGQGAVTADQPGAPPPTGVAPEDLREGGPDAMGQELDPTGAGEDPSGQMGVRIDPTQMALLQQLQQQRG